MTNKTPEEVVGRKTISINGAMAEAIVAFMERTGASQQRAIESLIQYGGEFLKLVEQDADIRVRNDEGELEKIRIVITI